MKQQIKELIEMGLEWHIILAIVEELKEIS